MRITKKLFLWMALLPLLVGCSSSPSQWQEWVSDLLGGPAPTVQTPPERGLQPTPTLASSAPAEATAGQTAPQATDEPAVETPEPAEEDAESEQLGPFSGTFEGTMIGDNETSAPLELQLVQIGRNIEGAATLGDGLILRAGGVCGSFPIPAMTINAADELDHAGERTLSTSTSVTVSGFDVPVELQAELGPDGNTVTAQATIYPPALCGTNPTVSATLTRVDAP